MRTTWTIAKRELAAYFGTPIAYVFLVIFLLLAGVFTFYVGQFFGHGTADLSAFFNYLPWLFMLLIPAIAMRLWAEERKSGTIELLMTLPVSPVEAVVGKWLAGTLFIAVALALTAPLWITVNYLGSPDNGVIAVSYAGALALAGALLAVGSAMSVLSRNQVIAFVLAVGMCLFFMLAGTPVVLDAIRKFGMPQLAEGIATLGAINQFNAVARGEVAAAGIVYAVSMIVFWLFANVVLLTLKKAD